MTIVKGKAFLSSRTVWQNVVVALGGALGALAGVIPPKYVSSVLAANGVLNILLRLITNQPITSLTDPAPKTIEKPGAG